MRLCRVKGIDAVFHKWAEVSAVIPPSPMVGGHSGSEIRYTTAIVESIHNGQVTEVMPSDIIFCDTEKHAKSLRYKKKRSVHVCMDILTGIAALTVVTKS